MTTASRITHQWRRRVTLVVPGTALTAGLHAQKVTPSESAARLTGTWKLNRELSPGFRAPGGPGRGGPGRGGEMATRSSQAPAFAMQRRGGSGGGDAPNTPTDLSPDERAAIAAMRELQQLADEITIDATAERVTFTDVRGERSDATDGKSVSLRSPERRSARRPGGTRPCSGRSSPLPRPS